ncbi:MAG: PAS domain S-box protein [Desulfobulbaceae bacterium]|nr:PAS domain S-box protein [Desulfobulbaceae bacterium]
MGSLFPRYHEALRSCSLIWYRFQSYVREAKYGKLDFRMNYWQTTFEEISRCLAEHFEKLETHFRDAPDDTFFHGAPGVLGVVAAKKHKESGVAFDQCLGVIKLLRQAFFTEFLDTVLSDTDLRTGQMVLERFFDLFEIGVTTAWVREETTGLQRRLREANHFILHEKRRYFTIFNRMAEPAFIVDKEKKLTDANQALEDFLQLEGKDLIGKSCCDVMGKSVCASCGLEKALHAESSFSNIETTVSVKGEERTVLFAGTFLGDINGEYAGGIIIIQDITEKKQFEKKLQESEEKYRSLIENVPDVTWRADHDGNYLYISPVIEKICGFKQTEMIKAGRIGWLGKIHPDDVDTVIQAMGSLYSKGTRVDLKYRFQRKDGRWIWLHDRAGNVYERDGVKYADGVLSDITELKKVEEELERHRLRLTELVDERTAELRLANEKLRKEILERKHVEEELMLLAERLKSSNAELEQFAHVASHDLKEPLLLVVAFSERLMKRYGEVLDDKGQEYLKRTLKAASQMQQLIEDLLHLSRVTTSARQFESIDLTELLNDVVQHLEERIVREHGRVKIHSLHTLEGDRMQVMQLFQNLITNALKFRKDDERPLIIVKSRTIDDDFCEISVNDNGIGFDEKYLSKIFNPFERLHSRSKFEGTGMGLATCKKIVVRHGGEITAKSDPGKGSSFIIRLPLWHP